MTICAVCKQEKFGGIHTNGDGYGDAKYVGIEPGEFQFFCWDCYKKDPSIVPDWSQKVDQAFAERGWCGFLEAWVGRCRKSKPCAKHESQTCWQCGAPATSNCSVAGSLVCGMPQCKEHPHERMLH